jgi:hypothetical protein
VSIFIIYVRGVEHSAIKQISSKLFLVITNHLMFSSLIIFTWCKADTVLIQMPVCHSRHMEIIGIQSYKLSSSPFFAHQLIWLSPYSWWSWLTFVRLCRNIKLSAIFSLLLDLENPSTGSRGPRAGIVAGPHASTVFRPLALPADVIGSTSKPDIL